MKRRAAIVVGVLAIVVGIGALLFRPDSNQSAQTYGTLVTLGDSYASGEGLAPYEEGTDTATNTCHRSQQAFAEKVADTADLRSVNAACSGARIEALTQGFKSEPAQLSRVKGASAVLVMVGGNDVDALSYIGNPTAIAQFQQRLPALTEELKTSLGLVRQESGTVPFLVMGYPSPVSAQSTPAAGCPFPPEQIAALTQGTQALNAAVRSAASSSGATFVDTTTAFAGHGLCDPDPWVNGLRLDNPPASLHPTAAGQEKLAELVSRQLPTT